MLGVRASGTGRRYGRVVHAGDRQAALESEIDAEAAETPPAEEGWERETVAYRGISRRLAAHRDVELAASHVRR